MKWGFALLLLAAAWALVTMWDAGTGAWAPYTVLYFLDLPQSLYVLLPAWLASVVLHGWGVLASGIALALGLRSGAEKDDLVKGGRALLWLGQAALWNGAAVTLIEAVISAHNAASIAEFLPALGVSLLAFFYGLLIRIVCGLGVQVIKVRLGPFVFYSE